MAFRRENVCRPAAAHMSYAFKIVGPYGGAKILRLQNVLALLFIGGSLGTPKLSLPSTVRLKIAYLPNLRWGFPQPNLPAFPSVDAGQAAAQKR